MDEIKKFEQFTLNEGMRYNTQFFELQSGEYPIDTIQILIILNIEHIISTVMIVQQDYNFLIQE